MTRENDELLIQEHNSETLFDRSMLRTNILSWIDFSEGESVLLIGDGATIIPEYLKSRGLAVEGCSSEEIGKVTEAYDYVISIGQIDFKIVKAARKLLKTGGSFIIAVQNRLGMMYQAGVPDFFTKKPFDAARGKDGNHSITYDELKLLLTNNGFEAAKWYYPMPDYRLATEIFSDAYLPGKGVVTGPSPSYEGDYVIEADEEACFNRALELGKFPEIANSFLVVCSEPAMDMIYAKFNSLRAPKYRLSTLIFEDSESKERTIEKRSLDVEALDHLNKMVSNYSRLEAVYKDIKPVGVYKKNDGCLKFDYIKGTSLLSMKELVLLSSEKMVPQIEECFKKIFSMKESNIVTFEANKGFEDFFGKVDVKALIGGGAFAVSNGDPIFSNFLGWGNEVYNLDYEWFFDFPVPGKYLKYRNLLYIYRENRSAFEERQVSEQEFIGWFGYTDDEQKACAAMEMAFQLKVHGSDLRYNYLPHYQWRAWTKQEWKAHRRGRLGRKLRQIMR